MKIQWVTATVQFIATAARAVATVIANTIAPIDAIAKKLGTRDVNAPRGMRRRTVSATRVVERAVIDQWLLWRD